MKKHTTTQLKNILTQVKPYLPEQIFNHLSQGNFDIASERREVTVLFADISGFTAMAEELDPEEVADFTGDILDHLGQAVKKRDGMINKFIGDALMAVFGAPISHKDDPRRAIEAALGMKEYIKSLKEKKLAISIGIHTGLAYAGTVGGELRREYTVMGDVVNQASRLESKASKNEILISETTAHKSGPAFLYSRFRRIKVKGRKKFIKVCSMSGRNPSFRITSWKLKPAFIGRKKYLRRIVNGIKRDGTLLVSGESGIGKSTLCEQVKSELSGKRRVYAVNIVYGVRPEPYSLLRKILFAIRKDKKNKGDIQAIEKLLTADNIKPEKVIKQFKAFLLEKAATNKILLLIENLHISDETSLYILNNISEIHNVSWVFTTRPQSAAANIIKHAESVKLDYLSYSESKELICSLLDTQRLPDGMGEVIRNTKGLPFAINEITRYLIEQGYLYTADSRAKKWIYWKAGSGQHQVYPVIRSHLDSLKPQARVLISRIAVLGNTAPWINNRDILANRDETESLRDAERNGILKSGAREVAFTHSLYQQVAYETILRSTRKKLHSQAADWLKENNAAPETLAKHLMRAERYNEAYPYLLQAIDRNMNAYAYQTAQQYLIDAEHIADREKNYDSLADIFLRRISILLKCGKYAEVKKNIEKAELLIDKHRLLKFRFDLVQKKANYAKSTGDIKGMKRLCSYLLSSAKRQGRNDIRISVLNTLGAQEWREGNYQDAIRRYELIFEDNPDSRFGIMAASSLVDLCRITRQYDKAEKYLEFAMRDRSAGWAVLHRGRLRYDMKKFQEAKKDFQETLSRAKSNEDIRLESLVLRELARTEIALGNTKSGLKLLEGGLRMSKDMNDPAYISRGLAEAALVYSQLKRFQQATEYKKEAVKYQKKLRLSETKAIFLQVEIEEYKEKGNDKKVVALEKEFTAMRKRQGVKL